MKRWVCFLLLGTHLLTACQANDPQPASGRTRYRLVAEQITTLSPPKGDQFDASGLFLLPSGEMLTLRNNLDSLLYRIEYGPDAKQARLVALDACFASSQLEALKREKPGSFDCEGIARDAEGRFYLCEERRRWILRCDPSIGRVERLAIDWGSASDYFSPVDANASFEGIAIGDGNLYLANERTSPRIIVVDLATLKVKEHFEVQPTKSSYFGLHYSDLSWFDEKLWVLCRQHRVVLAVDPKTRRVVAEFDYAAIEERLAYRTGLPVGLMEGLAVNEDAIWLVTDNNGHARGREGNDIRPTLIRCPRPDRKK